MESAHTPLPWRIRKRGSVGGIIEALSGRVSYQGDEGWRVVATYQPCMRADATLEEEDENAQANAELIVRAVNSYHDMLAALEGIAKTLETMDMDLRAISAHRVALAAIAKAKGE